MVVWKIFAFAYFLDETFNPVWLVVGVEYIQKDQRSPDGFQLSRNLYLDQGLQLLHLEECVEIDATVLIGTSAETDAFLG